MASIATMLDNLIETSEDAQSNLFTMVVESLEETYNFRLTKVKLPAVETKVVDLPYQNVVVQIPSTGTGVDKTVQATMRMDSNYLMLKKLYDNLSITPNGLYRGRQTPFKVTVSLWRIDALSKALVETTCYTFNNCYLLKVPSLELGYDSAQPVSISLTVVYSTYTVEDKTSSM